MTGHDFAAIYGLSYIEVNRILKRLGFQLKRGNQGSNFTEADLAIIYRELDKVKKMKDLDLKVTLKGTIDRRFKGETMIDADELEDFEDDEFDEMDEEDEDDVDSEFYDEDELGDDLDDLDDFNVDDEEDEDEELDDEDEEIDEDFDDEEDE